MGETIDLEAVRAFVQVARRASFRGAAESMGVPRATVSRRVARLESQLGTRLLHRTTRRVTLTEAGAEYLRECEPAIGALQEAALAVAEKRATPRGRLRLTAPVMLGERLLGPVVLEYLERYPEVTVDVVLSERQLDILDEGFDLAIRAGQLADSSLAVRGLGGATIRCYAAPAYLALRGRPRRPAELGTAMHECVIHPPLARAGRWTFRGRRGPIEVPVTGRLTVNSLALSVSAAIEGLGVVRLPDLFAREHQASGALEEVLATFAPPANRLHAVYPSRLHVPARVRAFLELLVERLA